MLTMKFDTFNAAQEFYQQSALLKPSRPYKTTYWKEGYQVSTWSVTLSYRPGQERIDVAAAIADALMSEEIEELLKCSQ